MKLNYDNNTLTFTPLKTSYKQGIIGFTIGVILIGILSFNLNYTTIPVVNPIFVKKDSVESLFLTDLDYYQIRAIESNNNDKAISTENAIGSMQITEICLQEWNKYHINEQYTLEDLYIRKINIKVGRWMLSQKIPMYLKQYNIPNSLNYKLIIYNAGIGNFLEWHKNGGNYNKLPEETRSYLLKYWQKY